MKKTNLWRGLTGVSLSLVVLASLGYGIADGFRTQVDNALGTQSYTVDNSSTKYVSKYKTGDELMNASKQLAVREGEEGTVIMKNKNNAFPLSSKVALFGNAAYSPYMSAAGNTDQVKLVDALETAGVTLDPTVKSIYTNLLNIYTEVEVENTWTHQITKNKIYKFAPNTSAGDYVDEGFQVKEVASSYFTLGEGEGGQAASNWKETVKANGNVGVCVFMRPGGEGTTYKPGVSRDANGNQLNQNPLALSPEELEIVKIAKETCGKVVVLLNTSCTIEVAPLMSGEYEVDGIAYIGIPNDYQFTGIANVLTGKVNATGALADTYAYDTASNPAMVNFGGGYFKDYESIATKAGEDPRWDIDVSNVVTGSFGGTASYSGGYYIVEAESIYTGYKYYETRYYDMVKNQFNASANVGISYPGDTTWSYDHEVCYPFGYGESYLDYTEKLTDVKVDKRVDGNITATIEITNNSDKDGKFLGQLYVHTPYTDYDKKNLVEKSAIDFLSSEKIDLKAHATGSVTITVPTKYIASYDYTSAKTYILDGGKYIFATGNGSHDAINNVLKAEGVSGVTGDADKTFVWDNGTESNTDISTFSKSASGASVTNKVDDADINYWLPDSQKVTYLSRSNWKDTYPKCYHSTENAFSISSSPKKDEWVKSLRNSNYTVKSDDPVKNMDGVNNNIKFSDISGDALSDINSSFWDSLVEQIPAEEALGAIAHGGNQSDVLTNVENPIVGQNDGPNGFNSTKLSSNNGSDATSDKYYVDENTEAGAFKANINSQTLLGSSFSAKLAEDWGDLLGNTGLWVGKFEIWGAALNYHRTAYNGRNTEYPSEDPMLCNIIGGGIIRGSKKYGIIVGPKHIGFNDQEHDRSGLQVYMTEQKVRETDLRGFEMAIEDEGALGMMVAFNRLGACNVSHNVGLIKGIFRNEWNFNGLISTDMMNNKYYFNPESATMATVTMMADFAANDNHLNQGTGKVDKTWGYLSEDAIKNDNALVEQARQNLKYQLYAFANSALMNVTTTRVTPWWEATLVAVIITFSIIAAAGICLIVLTGLKGE